MISKELMELVLGPASEWEAAAGEMSSEDLYETQKDLQRIGARMVLLGLYLENMRDGGGHKGSVKNANKKMNQIFRAMGYTFPERKVFDF